MTWAESSDEAWHKDKRANNWVMPAAPRWKRLPIIRHIRAAYHGVRVHQHQRFYRHLGMLMSGYDAWVLYGIRKGWEREE